MVQGNQGAGTPLSPQSSVLSPPQGRIFDLGYQPYVGPHQGRRRAVTTLFWSGLRRVWGIGRPFRSKVAPWALLGIALVPALITLGIAALVSERISPFRYDNYYSSVARIILLFCTIVAPNLLIPDQQQRVLSLYFSRAIARMDYVLARLGALVVALLIVSLAPQALLFTGHMFVATDTFDYVRENLDVIPRIVAAGALISLYFSSIALAISAYSARRVWAAGTFIALMLVSSAVVASIHGVLDNEPSRYLTLLGLSEAPIAATYWIFDAAPPRRNIAAAVDLPLELWLLVSLTYTAIALFLLVRRYAQLTA